jgi:Domain of unknown function (DUF1874)
MKLALLNTTICTTDGLFSVKSITLDEARAFVSSAELDSAIGHESTAQIMSTLLGVEVQMNRQQFVQQVGQDALVFKLKGRPAEGRVLDLDEIQEIGYEFKLMTRLEDRAIDLAYEEGKYSYQ